MAVVHGAIHIMIQSNYVLSESSDTRVRVSQNMIKGAEYNNT